MSLSEHIKRVKEKQANRGNRGNFPDNGESIWQEGRWCR